MFKYLVFVIIILLNACSGNKDESSYRERSLDKIYNNALDQLMSGDYDEASKEFDEVERQHPYSVWSRKAVILSAYSRYIRNEYELAIDSLNRYIELYPASNDIPYAYYLIALCYYEQIIDTKRDQTQSLLAYDALKEVVNRFPDSDYSRDSIYKIQLVEDHLAGKEMEVGRTYLSLKQYLAAALRFKKVIKDYDTTSHTPEALARMIEIYIILGVKKEVITNSSVLSYNFPDSEWYEYAYKLLKKNRLIPKKKSKLN